MFGLHSQDYPETNRRRMSASRIGPLIVVAFLSSCFMILLGSVSAALAGGLEYSTFLGGNGHDAAEAIDVDSDGNVYVSGETDSSDFPTTPGAVDISHNGSSDVFITKLAADGSTLLYSTFVGGIAEDSGRDIFVDPLGASYVVGETWSFDFPTTPGAFDRSHDGQDDAFVIKLNPNGSAFYSTLLGGSSQDFGRGIIVDSSGYAHLTGSTFSPGFPTTPNALDTTCGSDNLCNFDGFQNYPDAFIARLSPDGTSLSYASFLGGDDYDFGLSLALDDAMNTYVTGHTSSPDFPTTPGAFDTSFSGGPNPDAFVTKIEQPGTGLSYSTFVGGSEYDIAHDLDIDSSRSAYIVGSTESPDFPTTPGAFDTSCGTDGNCNFDGFIQYYSDAFVTKVSPSGASLSYSSYLGGESSDSAMTIAVDESASAYVAGETSSGFFPVTVGAYDQSPGGFTDGFVTKLFPAGNWLAYSSFFGASGPDEVNAVALKDGRVHMAGETTSPDFPVTPDAYDAVCGTIGGGCTDSDAFVTILGVPDISIDIYGIPRTYSRGDTLAYDIEFKNNTGSTGIFSAKTFVTGPADVNPLDGPVSGGLAAGANRVITLSKTVPQFAPLGEYSLCAEVFDASESIDEDCVEFEIVP